MRVHRQRCLQSRTLPGRAPTLYSVSLATNSFWVPPPVPSPVDDGAGCATDSLGRLETPEINPDVARCADSCEDDPTAKADTGGSAAPTEVAAETSSSTAATAAALGFPPAVCSAAPASAGRGVLLSCVGSEPLPLGGAAVGSAAGEADPVGRSPAAAASAGIPAGAGAGVGSPESSIRACTC